MLNKNIKKNFITIALLVIILISNTGILQVFAIRPQKNLTKGVGTEREKVPRGWMKNKNSGSLDTSNENTSAILDLPGEDSIIEEPNTPGTIEEPTVDESLLNNPNTEDQIQNTILDNSNELLWYTRHENGGIDEWTVGGGWNGLISEAPPASTLTLIEDYMGKNWIRSRIDQPWIDSDPFSDYKCRSELMRRGNLNEDGSWVKTETDVYYGMRLYLPSDFKVTTGTGAWSGGCSLIQLREHSSKGWGGGLRIWSSTQKFRIVSHHYVNGEWVYEELARDIPYILDRPFTVIFHINSVENGVFECWIDGELVAQDYDDYRMDPISMERGEISRYLQIGLYCGINQNQKEMLFTDIIVATSLEAVQSFLCV